MSQNFARFIFGATLLFFCAFFLWPILQILKGGFIDADGHLTFAYLGSLLTDPLYLGGLANSFGLALTTTILALLLAVPLALVMFPKVARSTAGGEGHQAFRWTLLATVTLGGLAALGCTTSKWLMRRVPAAESGAACCSSLANMAFP